jgi:hypothetical protein
MRIFVLFFVLFFVPIQYAQTLDDQSNPTDSTYFDYGQIFYHGLYDKNREWVSVMLCDSLIVGEAFSEGEYCTNAQVVQWLCKKSYLLPEPENVLIGIRQGDWGEKEILFFSQKKFLFSISVCIKRRIVTRLGIGEYLL